MKELAKFIATSLVSTPDEVEIEETEGQGERVLTIKVAADDRGTIVGRQGRTVKAIQTVLNAASGDGRRVVLEIGGR